MWAFVAGHTFIEELRSPHIELKDLLCALPGRSRSPRQSPVARAGSEMLLAPGRVTQTPRQHGRPVAWSAEAAACGRVELQRRSSFEPRWRRTPSLASWNSVEYVAVHHFAGNGIKLAKRCPCTSYSMVFIMGFLVYCIPGFQQCFEQVPNTGRQEGSEGRSHGDCDRVVTWRWSRRR